MVQSLRQLSSAKVQKDNSNQEKEAAEAGGIHLSVEGGLFARPKRALHPRPTRRPCSQLQHPRPLDPTGAIRQVKATAWKGLDIHHSLKL